MTQRLLLAALSTLASIVLASGPAFAPAMPGGPTTPDYKPSFNETAVLDTTQAVDPGACTLRTFNYKGYTWGYCTEDGPKTVDVMIP